MYLSSRSCSDCAGRVGVPKQLVIKKDASSIPEAVNNAGLRLPLGMIPSLCSVNDFRLASCGILLSITKATMACVCSIGGWLKF